MAGDWIKMRANLWDHPKVARMVDATESSEAAIIGACYWLWATADSHSEDGFMPGLTLRSIDRKTGVPGFAQAMCDVGWLCDGADGVTLTDFEQHNGASAKKRSLDAQRKANARAVSASEADKTQTETGQSKDKKRRTSELEKRREDIGIPGAKAPSSTAPPLPTADPPAVDQSTLPSPIPPCPHQRLLTLFAEHLPTLAQPRPELWAESAGAGDLRARWRWVLTAKRDGVRYAETESQALDWFARYFAWVAHSDFLMGRTQKPFACTLQWLSKRANFEKVLQGNFHSKNKS